MCILLNVTIVNSIGIQFSKLCNKNILNWRSIRGPSYIKILLVSAKTVSDVIRGSQLTCVLSMEVVYDIVTQNV